MSSSTPLLHSNPAETQRVKPRFTLPHPEISYSFNVSYDGWSVLSTTIFQSSIKQWGEGNIPNKVRLCPFFSPFEDKLSGKVQVVPCFHRGNLGVTVKIINKLHVIVPVLFCSDKAWEPILWPCWRHTPLSFKDASIEDAGWSAETRFHLQYVMNNKNSRKCFTMNID